MGLPPFTRVDFTPLNHTDFLMRMENLDDKFDLKPKQSSYYIDLERIERHFLEKIFVDAESPRKGFKLIIYETSISGNQAYRDMEQEKVKWVGLGDEDLDIPDFPTDKTGKLLTLEPQRIRTFHIKMI
jgi:hypothetical protein